MNTHDRISQITAKSKEENVKSLVDYRLTLIHKRFEIEDKIAKVEAEILRLSPATDTAEGTRIATNDK